MWAESKRANGVAELTPTRARPRHRAVACTSFSIGVYRLRAVYQSPQLTRSVRLQISHPRWPRPRGPPSVAACPPLRLICTLFALQHCNGFRGRLFCYRELGDTSSAELGPPARYFATDFLSRRVTSPCLLSFPLIEQYPSLSSAFPPHCFSSPSPKRGCSQIHDFFPWRRACPRSRCTRSLFSPTSSSRGPAICAEGEKVAERRFFVL